MSQFKVDTAKLLDTAHELEKNYASYQADQDNFYRILSSVEVNWNDNNTPVFLACKDQNKETSDKYHTTILKYTEMIQRFCRDINTLLRENGVNERQIALTYDETETNESIELLKGFITKLSQIAIDINRDYVSSSVDDEITKFKSNCNIIKNNFQTIKNQEQALCTGIEDILVSFKKEYAQNPLIEVFDNGLKYIWDDVDVHIKPIESKSIQTVQTNENDLNATVEEVKTMEQENVYSQTANAMQTELKEDYSVPAPEEYKVNQTDMQIETDINRPVSDYQKYEHSNTNLEYNHQDIKAEPLKQYDASNHNLNS